MKQEIAEVLKRAAQNGETDLPPLIDETGMISAAVTNNPDLVRINTPTSTF